MRYSITTIMGLNLLFPAGIGMAKESAPEQKNGAIQYSINKYSIDSGGGTSSAGNLQLTGTIGQADGDHQANGGIYAFKGGFHSKPNNDLIFKNDFD